MGEVKYSKETKWAWFAAAEIGNAFNLLDAQSIDIIARIILRYAKHPPQEPS